MAKFNYQARSTEATKKRATQQGGMYDSCTDPKFSTFSTSKEGDYRFRLLPPTWENPDNYGIDIYIHSSVGADNQSYLCKAKLLNEPCLICEDMARAAKSGEQDYADELKPYKRVLVWLIDRDKEDEGPKLWQMPWTIDRDINSASVDKQTNETLVVDHPDKGYDIEFSKQGKGMKTKYVGIKIARRSTPLNDDDKVAQEWLDFIIEHPLQSVLNYYENEHIEKVLTGRADKKKEDGDDKKPQTRTESRATTPTTTTPAPATAAPKPAKEKITDPKADLDEERTAPTKVAAPSRTFWWAPPGDKAVEKITDVDIEKRIATGADPASLDLMLVGEKEWKKAIDYGFKPFAPPPPKRPAVAAADDDATPLRPLTARPKVQVEEEPEKPPVARRPTRPLAEDNDD